MLKFFISWWIWTKSTRIVSDWAEMAWRISIFCGIENLKSLRDSLIKGVIIINFFSYSDFRQKLSNCRITSVARRVAVWISSRLNRPGCDSEISSNNNSTWPRMIPVSPYLIIHNRCIINKWLTHYNR